MLRAGTVEGKTPGSVPVPRPEQKADGAVWGDSVRHGWGEQKHVRVQIRL